VLVFDANRRDVSALQSALDHSSLLDAVAVLRRLRELLRPTQR
jgi:hypothetical protein